MTIPGVKTSTAGSRSTAGVPESAQVFETRAKSPIAGIGAAPAGARVDGGPDRNRDPDPATFAEAHEPWTMRMLEDYHEVQRTFLQRMTELKAIVASNPNDPTLRTIGQMIRTYQTERKRQVIGERAVLPYFPPRNQSEMNLKGKFSTARYILAEQFKRAVRACNEQRPSRYRHVIQRAMAD